MKDGLLIGIEWEPQFTLLKYPNYMVYFRTTKKRKSSVSRNPNNSSSSINLGYMGISNGDGRTKIIYVNIAPSYDIWNATKVASHNMTKSSPYRYLSIDNINFEVITKPVRIGRLQKEIGKAGKKIEEFCLLIYDLIGDAGIFLPNWEKGFNKPSKHINISAPNPFILIYESDEKFLKYVRSSKDKGFGSKVEIKGECYKHSNRVHLTVPYNFTDYEELLGLFNKQHINISTIQFYLYKWSLDNPMPRIKGTKKKGIFLGYTSKNKYNTVSSLI